MSNDEARSQLDAAIAREERTEEARRVYEKECDWLEGKLDAAIAERDEARQQIRDLRLADEDRKADQGVILREAARAESAEAEVKRLKERLGE